VNNADPSLDALRKLAAIGGPGFVQQMSDLFESHAPQKVGQLMQAFADGNLEATARAAHALKSTAGNVGAAELFSAAARIELDARGNAHASIATQLPALQGVLADATTRLRASVSVIAREATPLESRERLASEGRPRIALVEDNPDNRLLAVALLEDRYDVDEYENGIEALDGIQLSPPDLVLLDISLPGMDGSEVLARLRTSLELAHLPIVALTAHAMSGDRERFLGLGFDGYITKPIVEEQQLLDTIDALLGARAR
jgi:two-component system, cell cycle response regulator DivK